MSIKLAIVIYELNKKKGVRIKMYKKLVLLLPCISLHLFWLKL